MNLFVYLKKKTTWASWSQSDHKFLTIYGIGWGGVQRDGWGGEEGRVKVGVRRVWEGWSFGENLQIDMQPEDCPVFDWFWKVANSVYVIWYHHHLCTTILTMTFMGVTLYVACMLAIILVCTTFMAFEWHILYVTHMKFRENPGNCLVLAN